MGTAGATGPRRFGTFGGVFTPCTLTILGVIMFLRYGQVVGQSGVLLAVLILAVSKTITVLTGLSLSAIATNTRVRGGGAYFLISRSLGVAFGGAIGVVFYLAQAISVAMYVIGFTEALVSTIPALAGRFVEVATAVNLATFLCVYIGAGWTIRVQYAVLAVLGLAVVSIFVGAGLAFDGSQLRQNLSPGFLGGQSFFTMFALFFPAVTGIMAGANMSGDLANPARSIPRGTLSSILVTGLIYLVLAVLLGATASRQELIGNSLAVKGVALWPVLVTGGVFAATLSSALGSMMGAPRILQALARDEIFPRISFMGEGSGPAGEPRRAVVFTFVIAQSAILLGDLDTIAPIITMFFMLTYGLLNLATFYESVTKNPSYRPRFRFCPWWVSLLGTVGCVAVMFLINWMWALVAMAVVGAIHRYIEFREIESRWGDLKSGIVFERTRRALLSLETEAYHPKNWRPVILAFSGAWNRPQLGVYGHWLTAGHGILTLAHVVVSDVEDHAERKERYETTLRKYIAKSDLQAFPAVVIADELSGGIEALVQCYGIGGLKPNTLLFGWPTDRERAVPFGSSLRLGSRLGRSLVAARFTAPAGNGEGEIDPWVVTRGSIDVWWRGMQNGELMLLLAHLLHQNPEWRENRIRLLRATASAAACADIERHLAELAVSSRIEAEAVAVHTTDVPAAIRERSARASVVILGFLPPEEGAEGDFYLHMESLAGNLPRVLFVCSAGGMVLTS